MVNPRKDDPAETPVPSTGNDLWGSDAIAEMLRALGIEHVALNPGSSFRGLHDSLVNHLGNSAPKMLLCLHEEGAVSIAHGWAKVTGRPMAVILHANVGLMHGAMAIYNAWCDRIPMMILGATGPVAADRRRPWIDWIHTSRDQAAIIRPYVKWDDQPASLPSSLDAMARAMTVTKTAPHAPTYVCLDVAIQEAPLAEMPVPSPPAAYPSPEAPTASRGQVARLLDDLRAAKSPVLMFGRMSRSATDWSARVALADHFNARVVTDIKTGAVFPTDHPSHVGPPSFFLSEPQAHALRDADLIVMFDWIDGANVIAQADTQASVVNITIDHHLANGWSFDHTGPVRAGLHIAAQPDSCITALLEAAGIDLPAAAQAAPVKPGISNDIDTADEAISMQGLSAALGAGLDGETATLVRLPLGWDAGSWHFRHPLDYLGYDGGAGIGSGPGMLVGAALALKDSGRIPVAVLGDGDTMMGLSALWTAARYRIPMLAIVCNNRSFYNDEIHQEKVARIRNRPVENKWIGQAITGPDIDFAKLAEAQGLFGIGPIGAPAPLAAAIKDAVGHVRAGNCVLIDAHVEPGYAASMSKGMTK